MDTKGRSVRSDPIDETAESRCWSQRFTRTLIYWATGSIGTSFLPYYDYSNAGPVTWAKEGIKSWVGSRKVPARSLSFQRISVIPRNGQRFFDVQRWTEMPHGGHFAAMEEPYLLADDIRSWFRMFRHERSN